MVISKLLRGHLAVGCDSLKVVTLVRIQVRQQKSLTSTRAKEKLCAYCAKAAIYPSRYTAGNNVS